MYVLRNSAQKWPSYAYLPEDASPSPVELLVVCSDIDYESRVRSAEFDHGADADHVQDLLRAAAWLDARTSVKHSGPTGRWGDA